MEASTKVPDPLRLGLIGLGVGMRGLLPGFEASRFAVIAGVAEKREEAREGFRAQYGGLACATVEELCDSPDIDAVWIATPNPFHAPHAIAAATRGKHVIVSKPMALTLEECDEMLEAAEKHGVKLVAGHSQAVAPPIRKMAELVQGGELGELGMLHSWHYSDWMLRPRMPEELDEALGGGVIFRQAPHQVDIVRAIAGRPLALVRAKALRLDPPSVAGGYVAYLQFIDGTPATLVYSGYGHFDASELTFGLGGPTGATPGRAERRGATKDDLRYTGATAMPKVQKEPEHMFFGLTVATCSRADVRQSPDGVFVYESTGARDVAVSKQERRAEYELEELYHAVRSGKPIQHDGYWGRAMQEVVDAIAESSSTNQEIRLKLQMP